MAYIEIEKAIAEIDKGDLLVGNNAEWAKEIIRRTPTADVVPREEVEQIFAEIESVMYQNFYLNHSVILIDKADYTELKKKYIDIGDKR